MKKGVKKAPSVAFEKLPALAEAANRLAAAAGITDMVAVPAKRTVQWRGVFKSDVRKANAHERKFQDMFDTFGVSKHVAVKHFAEKGINYEDLIAKAYAAVGLSYTQAEPEEKDGKTVPTVTTKPEQGDGRDVSSEAEKLLATA